MLNLAIDPATDSMYSLDANGYYSVFQPYPLPTLQIAANESVGYGLGYDSDGNYAKTMRPAASCATTPVFAATSGGLYVTATGMSSWTPVAGAPQAASAAEIQRDVLYINTSAGMYRAPLATLDPFTPLGDLTAPAHRLAADPNSGVLYVSGNGGVWRSGDDGESWGLIANGDGASLESIAVDGAGDVYAPANGGQKLWRYAQGAWQTVPASTSLIASELFADPHRQGFLFAIENGDLSESVDGGKNWQSVRSQVHAIAFDPNRSDMIYAGTARGLLVSPDGGKTWNLLDAAETTVIAVAPSRSSTRRDME